MKVILKENIENLGKKGDIVNVASGYGRNYLIPKKIAMEVTASNVKMIEIEQQALRSKYEKEVSSYQEIRERFDQTSLSFVRKAGEKDVIFGSVSSADIKDALEKLGFEVEKKKILLDEPIKRLGNYTVPIKIYHEERAEVKVEVIKEGEKKKKEAESGATDMEKKEESESKQDSMPEVKKEEMPEVEKVPIVKEEAPEVEKEPVAMKKDDAVPTAGEIEVIEEVSEVDEEPKALEKEDAAPAAEEKEVIEEARDVAPEEEKKPVAIEEKDVAPAKEGEEVIEEGKASEVEKEPMAKEEKVAVSTEEEKEVVEEEKDMAPEKTVPEETKKTEEK